jgi:hypothetical protein
MSGGVSCGGRGDGRQNEVIETHAADAGGCADDVLLGSGDPDVLAVNMLGGREVRRWMEELG